MKKYSLIILLLMLIINSCEDPQEEILSSSICSKIIKSVIDFILYLSLDKSIKQLSTSHKPIMVNVHVLILF